MLSLQGFLGTLPILLLSLDINFAGIDANKDVEQHLEMGKKMLAAGQLSDALSHYHAAVEGDPNNYMTYFRRATVFLAMGKSKSALPDLDKVIELKPDFTAARSRRGNVKLKQGALDSALIDYQAIVDKEPGDAEAIGYLTNVDIFVPFLQSCPWDPELRELRADCYIQIGDYFKAVGDIQPTTKLRNDNTAAYFKLSQLYYQMGEADTSLMEVRECLKLDPDHKECFPFYKKVKKLNKQMESTLNFINNEQWEECVRKADAMLTTEPKAHSYVLRAKGHKCHCYAKSGATAEALAACQEVFDLDADNLEALCDRAEAYINNEQYEEAINDYQRAEENGHKTERVEEGLNRAQKLLKQSKKRDYYKILGVKRNARKREIEKAYRKLAAQWHPDLFPEEEKAEAEKKFIDIAAAKEVLTDPDMRQKFDNGEDPLDAEEQAQGGHHHPHWQQGFNPFGNSGFGNFKFHFN
ncbi:hypothetical protein CAPTEDRAFT_228061 [Capitella teleta]|uniref:J domain-containing protein n=1 Tax=Capitella teleta TaxID=283909 RepID=R7THA3_CAPTE|nr:hypothetical protein CAPTEDRAFT_228061 [Capitella teleta]|eukprot:ELT92807.1 hypothetical protein CAPTEDRAFT_228061 [Capitella teleta]